MYGGGAHRQEFGIRSGLFWDPTGRFLAFSREDQRPIEPYPYIDYTKSPPARVHGRYPMSGRVHSKVTIWILDLADDSLRALEHDPGADIYWTNVTFAPDGLAVYVALVNRGQDRMDLVEFDARTGARQRTLLTELDPVWIEPDHGPIFAPDGESFLWLSPRNGFDHLYRYARDGRLLGQVTDGDFDVEAFAGFSADGERGYVFATGPNPLTRHLC